MSKESLTLKWGSLKAWNFREDNDKARELLNRWAAIGNSLSAVLHHDTTEQKRIICELIDLGDFDTVLLDWDDKHVSKDEAKAYVMNYGTKS